MIGSGGHAQVLMEIASELGVVVEGVVTTRIGTGRHLDGVPILGDDKVLSEFDPNEVSLINGIGSLPGVSVRWEKALEFKEKKFVFETLIHPSALISETAVVSAGAQIMAGSILQSFASIGEDSIINTGAIVEHDCGIAERCHVAPGVTMSGGVTLGCGVHVGTGARLVQGVSVGEGSVIAAGAVVFKNVAAGMMYKTAGVIDVSELKR